MTYPEIAVIYKAMAKSLFYKPLAILIIEESYLQRFFHTLEEGIDSDVGGRKKVINGIDKALKYLEDDEMVELSLCVLVKLKELTDHEFMKMEFVAAE